MPPIIAASAISKRISDLEDVLRAQLLERSNKGIAPTPAGIALQNLGGFKCEVQHPSVIEQEAGPWDWPEPERGLVAGSVEDR